MIEIVDFMVYGIMAFFVMYPWLSNRDSYCESKELFSES